MDIWQQVQKSTLDKIQLHPEPVFQHVAAAAATSTTVVAAAAATAQVIDTEETSIVNFDLDNCEEITEADVTECLEMQENKENNRELSDKDTSQYMQILEKNVTKGGLFQGCIVTINNPVYNITIQK